jgi:hypothetical protein
MINYDIISIFSSILSLIGYLPEIYNQTSLIIYNKEFNICKGNIIWIIWIGSNILNCLYGGLLHNYFIMTNAIINGSLCTTVFILTYYNKNKIVL